MSLSRATIGQPLFRDGSASQVGSGQGEFSLGWDAMVCARAKGALHFTRSKPSRCRPKIWAQRSVISDFDGKLTRCLPRGYPGRRDCALAMLVL